MTLVLPVFPDAEAVIGFAIREAAIEGLDEHVYSDLPERNVVWPAVTIRRVGGIPAVREYLDAPRLDFNVWGNNKGEAHDVAQMVRTVVHELEGTTVEGPIEDIWISAVEDLVGVSSLPDPDTDRDRYVFSLRVYLRSL